MMALHKNYINGEWVEGKGVRENINPSDLSDMVGEYAQADRIQAEAAIAAARAAFPAWQATTPQQRADMLETVGAELLARKDEIGRLLSREEGKPLANGIAETMRAAQIFKFYAQEALRIEGVSIASVRPGVEVTISREALGVVGLICPWNFPIAIPAWKMAPALAFGNTVVFKPADLVPGTAWALVEILSRAGLPKGVVNLVMGRGSVAGQAMLESKE
ncbi:MAG TPA: aldehyde dehydrogenase family protein, partial [Aestuariivirga sp.]|nr:aldehyde dehydrogenase family protein [Aestuariivirga sp.]